MPEIIQGAKFLKHERLTTFDMDGFNASVGEVARIDALGIEANIEKVIKSTNGTSEYFLDYIIRTEKSPDTEKFAQRYLEDEMRKYQSYIESCKNQTKEDKPKKWYLFGNRLLDKK